jgi:hypothetical protein
MNRVIVIQSFRRSDVPDWIARCLASVAAWAREQGHDYQLVGDEAFELCGPDYLARAGGNIRTITNLARLELVNRAHADGYELAAWVDADLLVFNPKEFRIDHPRRYAFARETWIEAREPPWWRADAAVNNSVFACRAGEPDLGFLIAATRHVAMHRDLKNNYQVGGNLIKGLRLSLAFEMLDDVGMLSSVMVRALARGTTELLQAQARLHGSPINAANLCASSNHIPAVSEAEALDAIEALERSRGAIVNQWLDDKPRLPFGRDRWFKLTENIGVP